MALPDRLKARARTLKRETYALYLVARDPRTPWYAKVLTVVVAVGNPVHAALFGGEHGGHDTPPGWEQSPSPVVLCADSSLRYSA